MRDLTQGMENYLFVIFRLHNKEIKITPKAVSDTIKHNAASTLDMIKALKKKGMIEYKPYKEIKITPKGLKYAQSILDRKNTVGLFLKKFLLVENEFMKDSIDCIDYHLNDYLLNRFSSFIDFLNFCPCAHPNWIEGFNSYLQNGEMTDKCAKCMEAALENGMKKECQGC